MAAPQLTIMQGNALDKLRELPSESVHCVITSPPYWGLRDYSKCDCAQATSGEIYDSVDVSCGSRTPRYEKKPDPDCKKCDGTGKIVGVDKHQLGLENTPEEYISHLVEIFQEVGRVLRSDGIVWLNLGDSYYGSWGNSGSRNGGQRPTNVDGYDRKGWDDHTIRPAASYGHPILKPKDQCLIPHRVAIALQADGWWVRQTVIWNKPNPMPESCRDRCTSSHEYIFHLTKSARYFYDQEAIREGTNTFDDLTRDRDAGKLNITPGRTRMEGLTRNDYTTRNKRSVWAMNTKPYPEAHFATFPPELPETCIKAGTSLKGCCPNCGAAWERLVERTSMIIDRSERTHDMGRTRTSGTMLKRNTSDTIGWQPTCSCGIKDTIPCTVLDPFAGSGTTGKVARDLGRSSILIELNPEYIKLIKERTKYDLKAVESFV